jgi:rubredoxin
MTTILVRTLKQRHGLPIGGDPVSEEPQRRVAFSALPKDGRCPHCDARKTRFMRLDHGR